MGDGDDVDLSFENLIFGTPEQALKKTGNNKKKSRDKDKEKKVVKGDDETEEIEKNVILVATDKFGDKLNSETLLKSIEHLGPLKTHNFRENQSFGFLQYENAEDYERALTTLQNFDIDGVKVSGERCNRISAGRDPRTHEASSEFKNVTLVLKNLAFNLKLEQLQEMLNAQAYQPLSVAYLYDAAAMFRGMAFVKFREIEQAQAVFQAINGMDIYGRKLRVEYKRTLKEGEGGEDDKKLLDQLISFKNNTQAAGFQLGTSPDISFHCPSSFQRKSLHQMAEKLGLVHYSTGEGDNQFVVVRCKDNAERVKESPKEAAEPKGRDIAQNQSRNRRGSEVKPHSMDKTAASWGGFSGGSSWGKPSPSGRSPDDRSNGFAAMKARGNSLSNGSGAVGSGGGNAGNGSSGHSNGIVMGSSKPVSMPASDVRLSANGHHGQQQQAKELGGGVVASFGTSPSYRNSALHFQRNGTKPDVASFQISRQPRGPDGTNGFSPAYRTSRKNSTASATSVDILSESI